MFRLTSKVRAGREKEQMLSRKMLGLDKVPAKAAGSSFLSRPVSLALAALGGVGALAATYFIKYYNAAN